MHNHDSSCLFFIALVLAMDGLLGGMISGKFSSRIILCKTL